MKSRVGLFVLFAMVCLIWTGELPAQVSPTGTLTGTVTDPSTPPAAVVGAIVRVADDATGAVIETKSGGEGRFVVANLAPGTYTVTVTMQGFKKVVFKALKIVVGQTYDLTAKLDLGEISSSVVVEAGQEVLETTAATVGTTVTGKSITQLPFTSRDALDLAIMMPGAATTGRPRQTSFLGLPKGAINITYDGINAQDNLGKSNDGFFTTTRPRVDSVEEFSITTATQGAEQSGEGAVQIRFTTKRGGNAFHGGVWEYLRNDFFNSNYYFNNQSRPQVRRPVQRLNQYGYRIGGPILRDKLFFFTSFDFYSNPQSQARTRNILSQDSLAGKFTYAVNTIPTIPSPANTWTTCVPSSPRTGGKRACTVDLFKLAAAKGLPTTLDPTTMSILRAVESSRSVPGVGLQTPPNPWLDGITFNNPGTGRRKFPDFRFDWNAAKNHQFTAIYHYQLFKGTPDFLNSIDQTFPVAPFNTNQGSQNSNRNQYSTAWRWNIGSNKSNEVRFGLQTAQIVFRPDMNLEIYPKITNNFGTINLRPAFPSLIEQPFLTYTPTTRNTPVGQLIETFSWARGKHNLTFGGSVTEIRHRNTLFSRRVHTATLGLVSSDPASGQFNAAENFPGSSATDRTFAGPIYAMLTGRISNYSGTISVDPDSRQFVPSGPHRRDLLQREFGIYVTDSWRIFPSLTITGGLRWEYQGAPHDNLNLTFSTVNGDDAAFGVSGKGNLFKPGTLSGKIPEFQLNGDRPWWNTQLTNFAPSLGLAWQPKFENAIWKRVFGGAGKTVLRGGYSINYTREGISNFTSVAYANPGIDGTISATPGTPRSPCPAGPFRGTGTYPAGCLTLTGILNGDMQALKTSPQSFQGTGSFAITPFSGQDVHVFDSHLKVPMVQSWSFGIQREITPNMVVEVRYVGNHSTRLWRQQSLNEVNIRENGFLNEFKAAFNNLRICRANGPACIAAQDNAQPEGVPPSNQTSKSFAYWGLPGQVPLPILTAAFTGLSSAPQTDSSFRNGTFITYLDNGAAGSLATSLAFNKIFMCNLVGSAALPGAGCSASAPVTTEFPVNFWVANPHALGPNFLTNPGGAFLFFNGSQSTYNALQIELRRRPSKGLQFSGNYTFSKALTNYFGDSGDDVAGFTTLRDPRGDKGPSPWDLRHAFKLQAIYELPFGPGRKWSSGHAWLNRLIEGWELSGIHRWQTGRVFQLNSGTTSTTALNPFLTLNQNDPGVVLVGTTPQEIQSRLSVRKLPTGQVFFFPAEMIASDGANRSFIAPCTTPGQLCQKVFLHGPSFFRADLSLLKKTRVTERVSFEFRAEFLNAFNNINFFFPGSETTSVPTTSITSSSFGRITNAYRDVSTTDDQGGRIVQLVFRINF